MNRVRQKQEKRKQSQTETRNNFSRILKPIVDTFRKKPGTRKRIEPREPSYFSWAVEVDNDER